MKYPFQKIEKKWREQWETRDIYKTDLTDIEKKLYCLVMFIYPSGSKLHIGHWYNYGPTDSWARYKKLQGYNVFEPIGYDAFGLPAENYAVKTGVHPKDSTMENIADIREQLKDMGCMYDWNAELMTCAPEYFRWNQWLFLQMYKKGLAYRKKAPVNWCPSCQTVLANEQVDNEGMCERCGAQVERKNLTQWFFKITQYAEELLDGLNKIDWPEKTKSMQRNWIGKSIGTEVVFKTEKGNEEIKVFTTRPDTLFGVTYVVLAPESDLVDTLVTDEYKEKVEAYRRSVQSLSDIERTSTVKEKTGVPTGAYAINPVNGEKVPVWVADYVLASYGTGAVMAVPGHDERDFDFAKKYELPIRKVILEPGTEEDTELEAAYTAPGAMINSGDFTGTESTQGIRDITTYLEDKGAGLGKINYKLRDWLISRQRYWGTPIPVVYCDKCGEVPLPEDQLPLELPYEVDFKPGGASPLAGNSDFVNTTCPECGGPAKRDVDTMDTFVDSSWYYLRYLNPGFGETMFDKELGNKWTPVDMYVGGAEHATMHLLYARFIHKFLRDIEMVNSDEPFAKLLHQGTITNEGAKMSKSKGNVVNPNVFINKYGADVFRMYLMFMGPYELGGDWSDKGITGVDRFVQRVYQFAEEYNGVMERSPAESTYDIDKLNDAEKAVYRKVNQTLAKYHDEIDNFRFNTTVAMLMELSNETAKHLKNCSDGIKSYALSRLTVLVAPLAPHLGEECWNLLGNTYSIFEKPVSYDVDEKALVVDEVTLAVQVNGKLRLTLNIPADKSEEEIKKMVWDDDKIKNHTEGKRIIKEIYVKNRIYNIVAK